MKNKKVVIVALAALTSSAVASMGQGLTLNFANNTGDSIIFGGASHTFAFSSGTNGYQWNITGETGGSSALGMLGSVTGGPFSYGAITTSLGGVLQSAPVTGQGDLVISDGTGTLTGLIDWADVSTVFQSVGIVNLELNINVSDIVYTGLNPDLQTLVANQPGTLNLSFQFSPGKSLTDLSTGAGGFATSYSGSISVVPEPSVMALAALGVGGLGWRRLRRAK